MQHKRINPDSQFPVARRAAIDVGTNSVKLLVADVRGQTVLPVLERSTQTRLGRGFYRDHQLQPEAIKRTVQVIAEFASEARETGVAQIRVIATSAAREAVNQKELLSAIRQMTGLEAQVASGEQEADWVYQGVATDERLARQALLIVDVGGGSTEFILGDNNSVRFRNSYPVGAVRLLEQFHLSDPPTHSERERCQGCIRGSLADPVQSELCSAMDSDQTSNPCLVGTGGTATILARIAAGISGHDRVVIESVKLTVERVRELVDRLWALPVSARRGVTGLPVERADVILPGSLIYLSVMEQFHLSELRVSTRGLRHAAVLQAVEDGSAQSFTQ